MKLSINEKILIEMKRKKYTISSIATELGVSPAYISDILKGFRSGGDYFPKILKILGMEEEGAINESYYKK